MKILGIVGRLLGKLLLYLLGMTVGIIAFILGYIFAVLQRISTFIGGLAVLASVLLFLLGMEFKYAIQITIGGFAAMLVPMAINLIPEGFFLLKDKIIEKASDIDIL